ARYAEEGAEDPAKEEPAGPAYPAGLGAYHAGFEPTFCSSHGRYWCWAAATVKAMARMDSLLISVEYLLLLLQSVCSS
ncbi:hypothetical protein PFISCL1PPCAC_2831, partial [Pristionchus fissidentatus]